MNIGNGIFLMLLLVSGVFATSVAMAEDTSLTDDEVVEVSEVVAAGSISAVDINRVLTESGESISPNLKRVGFANTWRGHGWIENGESGYHITGFWAVQKFAALDADMASVEDTRTGRTLGRLHIAGGGNYKLVRRNSEISEDSITFDVVSLNDNRYMPMSDDMEGAVEGSISATSGVVEGSISASGEMLAGTVVGKFSLRKKASYLGLTTWEGSLVLDSGDLSGEWDVEFATTLNRIRQNAMPMPAAEGVDRLRAMKSEILSEAGVDTIEELTDEQRAEIKEQIGDLSDQIDGKTKSFWGRVAFWRGN